MSYVAVDVLADPQLLVGSHTRRAIAETIFEIIEADGVVSAATLRPALLEAGVPRDHLDKRMPAMLGNANRKGVLQWAGRVVASGNTHSANTRRLVKVYHAPDMLKLLEWVAAYQDAYHTDARRLERMRTGDAA